MPASNQSPEKDQPAEPCIFVIFGASGDLTKRKLLPSLYNLACHGLLPEKFAVVAVARRPWDDEEFRELMTQDIHQFATQQVDDSLWAGFREKMYYCQGDFDQPETYDKLGKMLEDLSEKHDTGKNVLFYLSTPPEYFNSIIQNLGRSQIAHQEEAGPWKRVIIEKPFGHDLESAEKLNHDIRQVLNEKQIYRIDHYLGKETVQNLLVFRFGNGIFEPIWNRRYIDHIQITTAESIGVEGRGAFYEQAGAMKDVMQNHLLMLLALVAMDPPSSLKADAIRNEKVKVLESIHGMTPEEVIANAVRGQYGAGTVDGKPVVAYRNEPKVDPKSNVDTFCALKLFVDNWRWAGVPFYLRTGKSLSRRKTEVVIQFRRAPMHFFGEAAKGTVGPNRLIINIQPDEGIIMQMRAKTPGPLIRTQSVNLEFNYADLGETGGSTGYETLIYDCMNGDLSLFHRSDMIEAAWQVVDPIIDVWASLHPRDFPNYAAGSWGPAASDQLLERDGRHWHNDQ